MTTNDFELTVPDLYSISPLQVLLVGMGADEQLVGYSRHRVKFKLVGSFYSMQLNKVRISWLKRRILHYLWPEDSRRVIESS